MPPLRQDPSDSLVAITETQSRRLRVAKSASRPLPARIKSHPDRSRPNPLMGPRTASCPHGFWGMRIYLCSSHQRSNRRFCPVSNKSNPPRSGPYAHRVMRTDACSFPTQGTTKHCSHAETGQRGAISPQVRFLCRQDCGWSASVGPFRSSSERTKGPWPRSQGPETTCRRVYGVAGETLCNSEEFLSWCLVKTT